MNQQYFPPMVQLVPLFFYYPSPCLWCAATYGFPLCLGHQILVPTRTQHYQHDQSPSSGPHWNQQQRFHQAEAQLPNQNTHGPSRTVAEDRSFGIDSGHAWIGADDRPGIGTVWRTPSKNPLIVDCNLTQQTQMRYSPYRRNYSSRPPRMRDNPSIYAIRMADANSTLFHYPSCIDHFINLLHWQEARWHLLRHHHIYAMKRR